MKQSILFTALGVLAFGAAAQEVGQVISTQPVVQQVAVPRQFCNNQVVMAPPQTSGGGGLLGAVVGGLVGSQIGHGGGRMAATGVGAVVGAIAGNNIEANGQRGQVVPTCTTETTYENRTVAYNVTYEYAGRQYTTQMANDPGPTVQLNVSPVGQAQQQFAPSQQFSAPVQSSGMIVQQAEPAIVYSGYPAAYPAYPAYPVYAPYPYYRPYAPVGISLGFVVGGHGHGYGGGHRRWR
ncbi:MAG: hypothetical protein JWP41_1707 [Ramlibacter sp.]|jgi:uncharacterized protein YcfJ|nr:hypothetical protein [Ramlibacter sp.]